MRILSIILIYWMEGELIRLRVEVVCIVEELRHSQQSSEVETKNELSFARQQARQLCMNNKHTARRQLKRRRR